MRNSWPRSPQLARDSASRVLFNYDAASRVTSVSRQVGTTGNPTQVNTAFAYDNGNRLTTIQQSKAVWMGFGYTTTPLGTIAYAYDAADRVTSQTDAEGTAAFSYDNTNQLTGVSGSRTESYGYDANGNRNTTGYTTGTNNEMTASPGMTYTYDNSGNMVSQTDTSTHVTTSYTYDYRNRLTSVKVGGTVVATYTYDALDRRIGVKDNGTQTWTVFDGQSPFANPYADFNGSGALLTRYLTGAAINQVLARTSSGGATAWYLTDRLGTVRDIVDTAGTVIDHVVYGSFGNITSETNAANGDRFKFAAMEWDAAIDQYYDHARWYGAGAGRFLSHDPLGFVGMDANLYRYVQNLPSGATDPSGETLVLLAPVVLGVTTFATAFATTTAFDVTTWLLNREGPPPNLMSNLMKATAAGATTALVTWAAATAPFTSSVTAAATFLTSTSVGASIGALFAETVYFVSHCVPMLYGELMNQALVSPSAWSRFSSENLPLMMNLRHLDRGSENVGQSQPLMEENIYWFDPIFVLGGEMIDQLDGMMKALGAPQLT